MINTPVHKPTDFDDEFIYDVDIFDKDGDYVCLSADNDMADELVKRINMHDELVELLKESKYAISETYGIDSVFVDRVNNALERCK